MSVLNLRLQRFREPTTSHGRLSSDLHHLAPGHAQHDLLLLGGAVHVHVRGLAVDAAPCVLPPDTPHCFAYTRLVIWPHFRRVLTQELVEVQGTHLTHMSRERFRNDRLDGIDHATFFLFIRC